MTISSIVFMLKLPNLLGKQQNKDFLNKNKISLKAM